MSTDPGNTVLWLLLKARLISTPFGSLSLSLANFVPNLTFNSNDQAPVVCSGQTTTTRKAGYRDTPISTLHHRSLEGRPLLPVTSVTQNMSARTPETEPAKVSKRKG